MIILWAPCLRRPGTYKASMTWITEIANTAFVNWHCMMVLVVAITTRSYMVRN